MVGYGLKYWFDLKERSSGASLVYEILSKEDASFVAQEITGVDENSLYGEYIRKNEDKNSSIVGLSETVSIRLDVNLINPDVFFIEDDKTLVLQIKKGNNLISRTFIQPINSEYDPNRKRTSLTLQTTTGFNLLENQFMHDSNGKKYTGMVSFLQILQRINQILGLQLDLWTSVKLKEVRQNANNNTLADTFFDAKRLLDNDGNALNCYEVLEKMANLFNATVFQRDGRIYFVDFDTLKAGVGKFFAYSVGGIFLGAFTISTNSALSEENDKVFENTGLTRIDYGKYSASTKFEYGRDKNFMLNGDFDLGGGQIPSNWNVNGGFANYERGDIEGDNYLQLNGYENTGVDTEYFESTSVSIDNIEKINFRLLFECLGCRGAKIAIIVSNGTDTWYLRKNGTWTKTLTTIGIDHFRRVLDENGVSYLSRPERKFYSIENNDYIPFEGGSTVSFKVRLYKPLRFPDNYTAAESHCRFFGVELSKIDTDGDVIVGEQITVWQSDKEFVDKEVEPKIIYWGDAISSNVLGALYLSDGLTLTENWYSDNTNNSNSLIYKITINRLQNYAKRGRIVHGKYYNKGLVFGNTLGLNFYGNIKFQYLKLKTYRITNWQEVELVELITSEINYKSKVESLAENGAKYNSGIIDGVTTTPPPSNENNGIDGWIPNGGAVISGDYEVNGGWLANILKSKQSFEVISPNLSSAYNKGLTLKDESNNILGSQLFGNKVVEIKPLNLDFKHTIDYQLLTANRTLQPPDADGVIATQQFTDANFWKFGGNAIGDKRLFGSTDGFDVGLIRNNVEVATLQANRVVARDAALVGGHNNLVLIGRFSKDFPSTLTNGYFKIETNNVSANSGGMTAYSLNNDAYRRAFSFNNDGYFTVGDDGNDSLFKVALRNGAALYVGFGGGSANYYDANSHFFRSGGLSSLLTISNGTYVLDAVGTINASVALRSPTARFTNSPVVGYVWRCTNADGTGAWQQSNITERWRGTWAANSGVAPSASPTEGDYYTVTTAGTFSGVTYAVNDFAYFNGTSWVMRPNGYTLNTASTSVLGGVRIGSTVEVDGSGILNLKGITPSSGGTFQKFSTNSFGQVSSVSNVTLADLTALGALDASVYNSEKANFVDRTTQQEISGRKIFLDRIELNLKNINNNVDESNNLSIYKRTASTISIDQFTNLIWHLTMPNESGHFGFAQGNNTNKTFALFKNGLRLQRFNSSFAASVELLDVYGNIFINGVLKPDGNAPSAASKFLKSASTSSMVWGDIASSDIGDLNTAFDSFWNQKINGTGFIKANGNTLSYDDTSYQPINANLSAILGGFVGGQQPGSYSPGQSLIARSASQFLFSWGNNGNWTYAHDFLTDFNANVVPAPAFFKGANNGNILNGPDGYNVKQAHVLPLGIGRGTASGVTHAFENERSELMIARGDKNMSGVSDYRWFIRRRSGNAGTNVSAWEEVGGGLKNETFADSSVGLPLRVDDSLEGYWSYSSADSGISLVSLELKTDDSDNVIGVAKHGIVIDKNDGKLYHFMQLGGNDNNFNFRNRILTTADLPIGGGTGTSYNFDNYFSQNGNNISLSALVTDKLYTFNSNQFSVANKVVSLDEKVLIFEKDTFSNNSYRYFLKNYEIPFYVEDGNTAGLFFSEYPRPTNVDYYDRFFITYQNTANSSVGLASIQAKDADLYIGAGKVNNTTENYVNLVSGGIVLRLELDQTILNGEEVIMKATNETDANGNRIIKFFKKP